MSQFLFNFQISKTLYVQYLLVVLWVPQGLQVLADPKIDGDMYFNFAKNKKKLYLNICKAFCELFL